MNDVDAPDVTLIRLFDRALDEAQKLRTAYLAAGESDKIVVLDRAISFVTARRAQALEGSLHTADSGAALGISRFIGDFDWGPQGDAFHDAAYAVERHWNRVV